MYIFHACTSPDVLYIIKIIVESRIRIIVSIPSRRPPAVATKNEKLKAACNKMSRNKSFFFKKTVQPNFLFSSKIRIKIKLNILVGTKGAAVVGYVTENKKNRF